MWRSRCLRLGATAGLLATLLAQPADATFPGRNGKIAFYTQDGATRTLRVMNADGTGVRVLRRNTSAGNWSPDGARLAGSTGERLWTMNADGSRYRQLELDRVRFPGSPSWSPDGRRLVFEGVRGGELGIFSARANGSDVREIVFASKDLPRVCQNRRPEYRVSETVDTPAWSPNGRWIAFHTQVPTAVRADGTEECGVLNEIHVIRPDGSRRRPLTPRGGSDSEPRWSPNGRRLLFNRYSQRNGWKAWTMDADGTNRRRSSVRGTYHQWSPDGRLILSVVSGGRVAVSRLDGSSRRLLAYRGPPSYAHSWQPRPR